MNHQDIKPEDLSNLDLRSLVELADNGNVLACMELFRKYKSRDSNTATRYLKKAITIIDENKEQYSSEYRQQIYMEGAEYFDFDNSHDSRDAFRCYNKAAKLGNQKACDYVVGHWIFLGGGPEDDLDQMLPLCSPEKIDNYTYELARIYKADKAVLKCDCMLTDLLAKPDLDPILRFYCENELIKNGPMYPSFEELSPGSIKSETLDQCWKIIEQSENLEDKEIKRLKDCMLKYYMAIEFDNCFKSPELTGDRLFEIIKYRLHYPEPDDTEWWKAWEQKNLALTQKEYDNGMFYFQNKEVLKKAQERGSQKAADILERFNEMERKREEKNARTNFSFSRLFGRNRS